MNIGIFKNNETKKNSAQGRGANACLIIQTSTPTSSPTLPLASTISSSLT